MHCLASVHNRPFQNLSHGSFKNDDIHATIHNTCEPILHDRIKYATPIAHHHPQNVYKIRTTDLSVAWNIPLQVAQVKQEKVEFLGAFGHVRQPVAGCRVSATWSFAVASGRRMCVCVFGVREKPRFGSFSRQGMPFGRFPGKTLEFSRRRWYAIGGRVQRRSRAGLCTAGR